MARTRRTSLKTFVYQVLAFRLLLVSLLIALVLGFLIFLTERNKVGRAAVDRVLRQVELFNVQADRILDAHQMPEPAVLQRELEAFAATVKEWSVGSFVLVHIYDMDANRVATLPDDAFPDLGLAQDHLHDEQWALPEPGSSRYHTTRLDGSPYVHVAAPLLSAGDRQVGYIEGVFVLSAETIAGIEREILTTVLLVILIVLITTAILYPVILGLTRKLAMFSEGLLVANLETLQVLGGAVAKRDSDTSAHNQRVTIMAVRLGENVGLDATTIQGLIKGAFLHDVGKIAIHDEILLKPGKLTDEEYGIMQSHVRHGQDIVAQSSWLDDGADVVRYHHEKYDGTGYPDGLQGEAIPVTARIFSIADVFDALTSRRPYKKALSLEETTAILEEGRGAHFDPALLTAFLGIAPALYEELSGREEEDLREAIRGLTDRYIAGGLETLHY